MAELYQLICDRSIIGAHHRAAILRGVWRSCAER